jgi:hypothetical protein
MALRTVALALLSIALIRSGIGLAAVQLAMPAVVLGSLGFVLALGWFGSVLLGGEQATARSPRRAERQRIGIKLNQPLHDLQPKV